MVVRLFGRLSEEGYCCIASWVAGRVFFGVCLVKLP
jgi:hypothetical protein